MRALAVSCIRSERTGIKVEVVGRVVAVYVGVFENVRLRAQYTEMANGVVDYLGVSIAEDVSEPIPSIAGVE